MENYINVLIVLILFFLVFGFAELLYKRKIDSYITRKVVHMGSSLVVVLLPLLIKLETVIVLGIGFFLLLTFSKRNKLLNSIHDLEDDSVGALLFAPSLMLTAIIFWPINTLIFQGAALILGLSDGVAGIVGTRYGRKKYKLMGTKTVEGSISFFMVTILILCSILHINGTLAPDKILVVFGSSLFLTIIEAMFGKGWDNLFIPMISGSLLYFLI